MSHLLAILSRSLFAALNLVLLVVTAGAQETVSVQLASGRTLTGLVDERTDDQALWLRTEHKSASLRRPIAWSAVQTMHSGEEVLTKETVAALATAAPDRKRTAVAAGSAPFYPAEVAPPPCLPRALQISAQPGNWDRDAEFDGLLLTLRLLDDRGAAVLARGQLEIECLGLELRHGKPDGELTAIERWSLPLCLADFRDGEATLPLPWGAVNPVSDLNFTPWGLMRVRLSIPGHDTLEAVADGVRLRAATPVLDWRRVSERFPR